MSLNNKNNNISIAKGLGITLMVMGHCGVPAPFDKLIYQFHMPLFFFCSGYFIKNITCKDSLFSFYYKRFKSIYIKFLLWSILFLLLHNVFYHINIYNDIATFQGQHSYLYTLSDFVHKSIKIAFSMNEHEQLVRSFWFLKQLFLASLIVSSVIFIINKSTRNHHKSIGILVFFFLLSTISKYLNWSLPAIWDISLVSMSCTFYMAGYVFRAYNVLEHLDRTRYSLICVIISLTGLFTLPWTNMLEYTTKTIIPFYIVAFSGIVFIINLSRTIEKSGSRKMLYYLGQNTMVIFALHMLCFKIGNLIKLSVYNMPLWRLAEFQIIYDHNTWFWILYTIIGICMPLLIDFLMKQSLKTKKVWKYFV